ncbi:MAG: RDD family protein, partial [Rhodospirillales bacterium]|nr:RDD family protein [Acetobacter sp.]
MPAARRHTLDIRLPEGVVFSLPLAGPATRFLAWLIDLVFTLLALLACSRVLGFFQVFSGDAAAGASLVLMFVVPILYGVIFEG